MDPSPGVIEAQFKVLKNALHWDVDAVSKRNMRINEIDKLYPISGHDGEWLGVLGGAWGAFLRCTCVCVWVCVYVFARWCKYESGRRMQSSVILMLKITIRGGLWENLRSTNGVVSSLKVTTSLPTSDRVTPHHITSQTGQTGSSQRGGGADQQGTEQRGRCLQVRQRAQTQCGLRYCAAQAGCHFDAQCG